MSNLKCPNIKIYKCSDGFVTDNAQVAKSHEANIKSNKLICPFCQQELKPQTMDGEWLECWNCSYHEPSHHPFPQRILCGTKELWQELIRTRKALEVAKKALDDVIGCEKYGIRFTAENAKKTAKSNQNSTGTKG